MRKRKLFGALILTVLSCLLFAGCSMSSSDEKTPQQLIADGYGNNTYNISFSSDGLDEPIRDMIYTAGNMPKLPTPEKVGYIFSGWYMDKECTVPYSDGILYLYMKNVVLYPKWIKEEFVQNGTYDIEFEANILEETIELGEATERYGGFQDFTQNIIQSQTYIEKSDGHKLLKIQYDAGYATPFTASVQAMTVTVGRQSASNVRIIERIQALNDQFQTVFIDIDDIDLSETIYLNVTTTNYGDNVPMEAYNATTTKYTVSFRIAKVIGFSAAYVDTDVPLDEGWYLAKTYYKTLDSKDSMGSMFNPVYSYIYSDGENYTLVKPNYPYEGLISGVGLSGNEKYFNRLMTFIPVSLFYEIDLSETDGNPNADYFPSENNGLYYGNYAVEYHADQNVFYNIFDLGKRVDCEFVVQMAVTGHMEAFQAMGYLNQKLIIDDEHLIKLSEVDYTPLSGDSYEYQSTMQYYPGKVGFVESDIKDHYLGYDAIKEYGVSNELINFFYTDKNKIYSSRIEITPTAATNARSTADSRYIIAHFDVNARVFGYDLSDGDLMADTMTIQSFGSDALRENRSKVVGKSLTIGDIVHLDDIYAEKVNKDYEFGLVQYELYEMTDGKVDYTKPILQNSPVFTFTKDVAVLFTSKYDDETRTTLVELTEFQTPDIRIHSTKDFPYDENAVYSIGQRITYPYVTYSWMGASADFVGTFYVDDEPKDGINIVRVVYFDVDDNGNYSLNYARKNDKSFVVSANKTVVLYELTNRYGERYDYEILFFASDRARYEITDNRGNVLAEGVVRYNEKDESIRKEISVSYTEIITESTYSEQLKKSLTLTIGATTEDFEFTSYNLYTDSFYSENVVPSNDPVENVTAVWNAIKDSCYAWVQFKYKHGSDYVTLNYIYRFNFSGKQSYTLFDYESYFSNYRYEYPVYTIYGSDGTRLGYVRSLFSYGVTTSYNGTYQEALTFNSAGKYQATYYLYIDRIKFGGAGGGTAALLLYQNFEVLDRYTDVYITYKTDAAHPFFDGTLEKTVTESLAEDIVILSKSSFARSSDILYGFTYGISNDASRAYRSGSTLENYISKFNAQSITLYALWDSGMEIKAQAISNADQKQFAWLNEDGAYEFKLSDFESALIVPDGYKFIGWTGGFIGDRVVTGKNASVSYRNIEWDNPDFFTISAVFKKILNVGYQIDGEYSDDWQRGETVLEGGYIANPNLHSKVSCKVAGYEFKGWYVKGDETKTIVNLSTYEITENTTFVALFGPIGE